jgi:GTP-binding protein
MLARVTIIGRPNVGKSSIFNSLSGHRIAIISDIENTTRDIIEYHIDDPEHDISYMMADSGGIVSADNETLLSDVRGRANDAILASDLILFVVEYDRMTEFDEYIVRLLRRSKKPVLVVANKADNPKRALEAYQHMSLGLGDVVPVSAVQTRGFGELRVKVAEMLKELGFGYVPNELHEGLLRLAIIGRPNVGKSSLVNAIA